MRVWYESDNPNGFRTGQRFPIDAPCLTVMADGLGGDSLGHWHFHWDGPVTETVAADSTAKPPYRVPLMTEVAAISPNSLTVASTFSGCGGSCLGYRLAGYRVVWASELVPIAAETYRANAPDTILDPRDIREVTADEILAATGLARGELDLLDGSPPCQPFSTAGKREKTWGKVRDYGDHRQRADDLFYEYVRLVDGLQPRVFVAENVSGLVKGTAKGYFKRILAALKACGYVVQARLLDAQWLGVPQARQRIIFVGVRSDLGRLPAFPSPLPYRYSVCDALPWIGAIEGRTGSHEVRAPSDPDRPMNTIGAAGAEMSRFEVTLTGNDIAPPVERRKFTIAELKRICAFPDDFVLMGTYAEQWARLGNAVPPIMMQHIATAIRDEILLPARSG